MKQLSYKVRFVTPAFLGNAEQVGQWRTPPFKALMRQWWRVAMAQDLKFDVDEIRRQEGVLFGVAADGGDSLKSRVRVRLDDWSLGKLSQAPGIGHLAIGKNKIPAALYSGYGPVIPGPKLKANAAIQFGAETRLHIAFPEAAGIEQVIELINAYGALGGRSRNGWGSLELEGECTASRIPTRDWKTAMQLDWPHSLGKDEKGTLIWQSLPQQKWEDAMQLLAQVRADVRRAVPDRLMLAYPVTKATMPGWGKNERVPNSLRFKVRAAGKQFVAVIFHMPCRPADVLWQKLSPKTQQGFVGCFAAAHAFLDRHQQFYRAEA